MNKKTIFISILSLFLVSFWVASGAESNRYLVKSDSQFWKNAFNSRHQFGRGFSADLNDWQLRVAKIFNLEVESVGILQILPQAEDSGVSSKKGGGQDNPAGGKPKPSPSTRPTPRDQTPWGIEYVYNNSLITKTSGGLGAKVAILDTGVNMGHPDLEGQVSKCKDFTNFRQPVIDGKCDDKNGHGTHVAGIIAADGGNDGLGIYGVAPSSSLFAFKVCSNSGVCYADDIARALEVAADEGANIINLSLGSDRPSPLINEAINYAVSKGLLVVAAAGNDGPYFSSIDYPAAQSTVVAVGAFGQNFVVADWSSRGANSQTLAGLIEERDLELAAPGVNIESTWKDGSYYFLSGTSMASPFVSGLAAKYWSSFAQETDPAKSLRSWMSANTLDIDVPGEDDASGLGFFRVGL